MYTHSIIQSIIAIRIVMNIHSKKIVDLVDKEGVVTSSEIADILGVSWNTAEKYLLELGMYGKVRRIKKKGVTLWVKK